MQNSRASCFIPQGGDSILTAGIDGQLLATLGSVVDSDNPAASQRCTNAGGVASVDKRSTQLGLYCNGLVNHDTCVAGTHSPVT